MTDRKGVIMIKTLTFFTILLQFLWAEMQPQDIANPIEIVNGKPMNFTTDANENWYIFTMKTAGNIGFFGSDNSGSYIHNVYIYDNNDVLVYSDCCFISDSISLTAGTYRVNLSDENIGTFSIYSKDLLNPVDPNPILGSIANPYIPYKGTPISFNTELTTNVYRVEMDTHGNIILSGSDSSGSYLHYLYVYDENMTLIYTDCCFNSDSIYLGKGLYYIMIADENTGSVSIYSSNMTNPAPSNPLKGSVANPYIFKNGVDEIFNTDITTNTYYFQMNSQGNVILSGSDSSGSYLHHVYIYNSCLMQVFTDCCFNSDSINLSKGSYYLVVADENTGTVSAYSSKLHPNPMLPTKEYHIQGTSQCTVGLPVANPGIYLPHCISGRLVQGTETCDNTVDPVDPPGFTLPTCPDSERLIQGTNECILMDD